MKAAVIKRFIKKNPGTNIVIGLFIENRGNNVVIRHGTSASNEIAIPSSSIKDSFGGDARGTEIMLALKADKVTIINIQTTYTCPTPNQIIRVQLDNSDLDIQYVRISN